MLLCFYSFINFFFIYYSILIDGEILILKEFVLWILFLKELNFSFLREILRKLLKYFLFKNV